MSATLQAIGDLIRVREDGLAILAGRRISVVWIADLHNRGLTVEEMVHDVFNDSVSFAEVHAALAFYWLNRDAIEADQAARDAEYDRKAAAADSLADTLLG